MDLNARVDVNSARKSKFSNGYFDLIPQQIFFILTFLTTKVPLMLPTKFQHNISSHISNKIIIKKNISSHSIEKDDFIGLLFSYFFAIFIFFLLQHCMMANSECQSFVRMH